MPQVVDIAQLEGPGRWVILAPACLRIAPAVALRKSDLLLVETLVVLGFNPVFAGPHVNLERHTQ